jgi:hypothetical protein
MWCDTHPIGGCGPLDVELQAWLCGRIICHAGGGSGAGGRRGLGRAVRRRDLKVLGLVDVGAARAGVEGRDEGRELALENVLIIPCASPRPASAATCLQLLLFL